MGNCATPQYTKKGGVNNKYLIKWPTTAKIIHLNGRLQELRQPVKAKHILSENPKCFLCSSEFMILDSQVPHVVEDEDIQLGQIYFLLPLSKSQAPLTLQELCLLVRKASAALSNLSLTTTPQVVCCEVPIGFDFATVRCKEGIEFV